MGGRSKGGEALSYNSLIWQNRPSNPARQTQTTSLTRSIHWAPFWQGILVHSLISEIVHNMVYVIEVTKSWWDPQFTETAKALFNRASNLCLCVNSPREQQLLWWTLCDSDHQNGVAEFPECFFFTEMEAIEVIQPVQSAGLWFLRQWAFQSQWSKGENAETFISKICNDL